MDEQHLYSTLKQVNLNLPSNQTDQDLIRTPFQPRYRKLGPMFLAQKNALIKEYMTVKKSIQLKYDKTEEI
jgi:hypothetical protein